MKKLLVLIISILFCFSFVMAEDLKNITQSQNNAVSQNSGSNLKEEKEVATSNDKKDDFRFFVDGFLGVTGRFGYGTFIPGGTVSLGFNFVPEMTLSFYAHGEYFFAPLGSKTGELVGREIEAEAGLNFMFPIFKRGVFALRAGVDFGYYMQWLEYNSSISSLAHLSFNGLMIRPMLNFMFCRLWNMPISLSLFYQVTAIGVYTPYNGFGIMFTI